MKLAGIPPIASAAHLSTNCGLFASMEEKEKAISAARLFESKGCTMRKEKLRHSLMFCGPVGTGKSWLATAVFKERMYRHEQLSMGPSIVPCYWRGFKQIVRDVQSTYSDSSKSSDDVINNYARCKLLLIDDFGDMESGKSSDDQRSISFEIIDYRNSHNKETLFTTNLEVGEMEAKYGSRLFDRIMEMCSVITMRGDNMRRTLPDVQDHVDLAKIMEAMPEIKGLKPLPKDKFKLNSEV